MDEIIFQAILRVIQSDTFLSREMQKMEAQGWPREKIAEILRNTYMLDSSILSARLVQFTTEVKNGKAHTHNAQDLDA